MGTNYYWTPPAQNVCEHCKRQDAAVEIHIGKASSGWCFALHIEPENGISNLEDWKRKWSTGTIRNEYDEVFSPEFMLSIITKRATSYGREPKRHDVGYHCVGYGSGPWDYMTGRFS